MKLHETKDVLVQESYAQLVNDIH